MPNFFLVALLGIFVWHLWGRSLSLIWAFLKIFNGGNKFDSRRRLRYCSENYQENPLETCTKLAVYSSPAIL